jgi:hypothetical protein
LLKKTASKPLTVHFVLSFLKNSISMTHEIIPSRIRPRSEWGDETGSPPPTKRPRYGDNNSSLFIAGVPSITSASHFSTFLRDTVWNETSVHVHVVDCVFRRRGGGDTASRMNAKVTLGSNRERQVALQALLGTRYLQHNLKVLPYSPKKPPAPSPISGDSRRSEGHDYYGPAADDAAAAEEAASYYGPANHGDTHSSFDDCRPSQQASEATRVRVFNVHASATTEDLVTFIEGATLCPVKNCRMERRLVQERGVRNALVSFESKAQAKEAVRALEGLDFWGLVVYARMDLDEKPIPFSAQDSDLTVQVTNIPLFGGITQSRRRLKSFFMANIKELKSVHDIDAQFIVEKFDKGTLSAVVGFRDTCIVSRAFELDNVEAYGYRLGISRCGKTRGSSSLVCAAAKDATTPPTGKMNEVSTVEDPDRAVSVTGIPRNCPEGFHGIWRTDDDVGEAIKYFVQRQVAREAKLDNSEAIQILGYRVFAKETEYRVLLEFAQKDMAAEALCLKSIYFYCHKLCLSKWKNKVRMSYDPACMVTICGIPPPSSLQFNGRFPYYDSVRDELMAVITERIQNQFGTDISLIRIKWCDVRAKMSDRQPVAARLQFFDREVAEKALQLKDVFLQGNELSITRMNSDDQSAEAAAENQSSAVYVRNIPVNTTEEELAAFLNYKITRLGVKNPSPRCKIRSGRGDAMVEFAHSEAAQVALEGWASDDRVFRGNLLSLKPWLPKSEDYFVEKAAMAGFNRESNGDYYGQDDIGQQNAGAAPSHYCNPDHAGGGEDQEVNTGNKPDTADMSYCGNTVRHAAVQNNEFIGASDDLDSSSYFRGSREQSIKPTELTD